MLPMFSSDVLLYVTELLGFILTLVGVFAIFFHSLAALYQLFRVEKKVDDVRKQYSRKLMVGLEFVIAAGVIVAVGAQDQRALVTLVVLVLMRVLLGNALVKETKV